MRTTLTLIAAAAASLALLGGCNKPTNTTATSDSTAAAADSAVNVPAASADATGSGGGAVSPPASNGAVNTDANTTNPNLAAASNSFTMGQAKEHIEHAGYAGVSGLTKTPNGLWVGQAVKDGKPVTVAVDFKGAVSAK